MHALTNFVLYLPYVTKKQIPYNLMNKIGFFNIGHIGCVNTSKKTKTDLPELIKAWIPKHMVFWYDVGKQGDTNETLKVNSFLQDFSGNDRPLKLYNFLFAEGSAVNGAILTSNGIDNYGEVQNYKQKIKMLFLTCIPFSLYKTWYKQNTFSIYGQPDTIAYNFRNIGGRTYLDGILNESQMCNELLNKKKIVTIVNDSDGNDAIIYFFSSGGTSFMDMAFYNSIGFDSIPNKDIDGFTEQDIIDYYTSKDIVTVTVTDTLGLHIEGANVVVDGITYQTLVDGTAKINLVTGQYGDIQVSKDGYMTYHNNNWEFTNTNIILEVLRDNIILENGGNITLENNGLILLE